MELFTVNNFEKFKESVSKSTDILILQPKASLGKVLIFCCE